MVNNTGIASPGWLNTTDIAADSGWLNAHNIFQIVVGLISLLLNVSIFFATFASHEQRAAKHWFILSLAAADGLCSANYAVLNAVELFLNDTAIRACVLSVTYMINYASLTASSLSVLCLAIDLYVAVFRPLHYQQVMNVKVSMFAIVTLWMLSVVMGFTPMAFVRASTGKSWCHVHKATSRIWTPHIAFILLCVVTSISAMFGLYYKIGHTKHVHRKGMVTLCLLVSTFVVSWLSVAVLIILMSVAEAKTIADNARKNVTDAVMHMQYIANMLLNINALVDPIIYAIRLPFIRQGYHELFKDMPKICKN